MTALNVRDVAKDARGKRVLVRVDFNVPLDDAGRVTDDTRITAAMPTIQMLVAAGARVVLLSHFGRPKGKPNAKYSLKPVADALAAMAPFPVAFFGECDTDAAVAETRKLQPGSVLLL